MCEFLDFIENRGIDKGRLEGEAKGRLEGEAKGRLEGQTEGRIEGETNTALLMKHLFEQNRIEDARHAAYDDNYRHTLMKELMAL